MVRGHSPQHIEYNQYNYDVVWRTHFDIFKPIAEKSTEYGVAIESEAIMPHLYRALMQHHTELAKRYKNIFTWHQGCLDANPNLFKPIPAYCGWIYTTYGGGAGKILPPKTKRFSTICSEKVLCRGHQLRQMVSSQFTNRCDCYGNFFKNPVATSWDGIADYKFHLVIENDATYNYFTEKVLNCFQTKTVPIYWGCVNLKDFGFDLNGIISLEKFMETAQGRNDLSLDRLLSDEQYKSMESAIDHNYAVAMSTYNVALEDIIYGKYFGK